MICKYLLYSYCIPIFNGCWKLLWYCVKAICYDSYPVSKTRCSREYMHIDGANSTWSFSSLRTKIRYYIISIADDLTYFTGNVSVYEWTSYQISWTIYPFYTYLISAHCVTLIQYCGEDVRLTGCNSKVQVRVTEKWAWNRPPWFCGKMTIIKNIYMGCLFPFSHTVYVDFYMVQKSLKHFPITCSLH